LNPTGISGRTAFIASLPLACAVQTYSRSIVGKKDLPPPKGAELAPVGMEFYPECVEHVVRYASKETKVPIIVTENGIATEDDTRRVEYFECALAGLKRAIDDGVDVRGYVAWSLMDNFEWQLGFTPKFGLVAVDLETQKRTIKPSGAMLGKMPGGMRCSEPGCFSASGPGGKEGIGLPVALPLVV
jgi:beta-glucosidase